MSQSQSSFDMHEVHEVAILVTTPSLDCSSLSPEPSPQDTPSSLGSCHGTPAVKFAPLPQIDPNRKRILAPLGVPGRSRRIQVIQQEGGSLLWSTDPDAPEEDPIIMFAKLVKKTSKTLWRKVRRGGGGVAEPVLDMVGEDKRRTLRSTTDLAHVSLSVVG